MENNILYLDCNRSFASIKEEVNRNIWTNEFDSIFIPKGSSISIQNALVNIQGIEGGSIEIREDENIGMNICFYISHSNYPIPKFQYNAPIWATDYWQQTQLLDTLYTDAFHSQNTHKLFSPGLKTKLDTPINFGINDTTNVASNLYALIAQDFGETNAFGGMEIPLYACYFDAQGYLRPHTQEVKINIPKGTYGISQLSELITEQLLGKEGYTKTNPNSNLPITDYLVNDAEFANGHFRGQCIKNVNFWDYSYRVLGTLYEDFPSIINNLASSDIAQLHAITAPDRGNRPVYILADQFKLLMGNFAIGEEQASDFQANTFVVTNGNYIATLKNQQYQFPYPLINQATPNATYVDNASSTINPSNTVPAAGSVDTYRYTQNPYLNGYFIGTNTIKLEYDTTNAGFSFTDLHTSRIENSHDMIGNVLTNEGQSVSHLKDNNLFNSITNSILTETERNELISAFNNPRSRSTGIEIYNWDKNIINKNKKIPIPQSQIDYSTWDVMFQGQTEEKENIWSKTFWYRIGFDFKKLNDVFPIKVSDQQMTTYGMTTNNQLDASVISSICSNYSTSQSTSGTDFINSNMPQTLLKQLKVNDIYYHQGIQLSVSEYTYKAYKNCMYQYANAFSVVTSSISITATRLPILSDEGYFLITSDIVGAMNDVVKKKQPIPLLGIVPKSNLSNQDFINTFQEITHITQQDRVLNQIKFGIFNADLTSPQLNEKSSIILKIVLNQEAQQQEAKEEKKIEKITSELPQ